MASRSSCSALMRPCSNLMTSSRCVMVGPYCVTPATHDAQLSQIHKKLLSTSNVSRSWPPTTPQKSSLLRPKRGLLGPDGLQPVVAMLSTLMLLRLHELIDRRYLADNTRHTSVLTPGRTDDLGVAVKHEFLGTRDRNTVLMHEHYFSFLF